MFMYLFSPESVSNFESISLLNPVVNSSRKNKLYIYREATNNNSINLNIKTGRDREEKFLFFYFLKNLIRKKKQKPRRDIK